MYTVTFYNAGSQIEELFAYSQESPDRESNYYAKWLFTAPKESFFEVPEQMTNTLTGGVVAVQFARDVTMKFGARGVIRLDVNYDKSKEDAEQPIEKYPYAATKEGAVERGKEIWWAYIGHVVQAHIDDCESARTAGGTPRAAAGFTKRALKLMGVRDPAEAYMQLLKEGGSPAGDFSELRAQNAMLMAVLMGMLKGEPVDPELLAKISSPSLDPSKVQTGIMTGKPSVQHPVPEPYKVPTMNRSERSKRAAAELK